MRVGWLHDDPGYLGGAELTMAEFKAAAPTDVGIVECPPTKVVPQLDCYVVGNCMTYPVDALDGFDGFVIRYHNDVAHAPLDEVIDDSALVEPTTHVFCSPLQRERMGMEGECIPPALDLERFKRTANSNHRHGAVCIGRMAYGKGLELLAEYEEPVDVYSSVPIRSEGNAHYRGAATDVAGILSHYERFVFLPTAIEPFGRAVVEAWASGLEIVVNKNVGAVHWICNEPEKLETAAEDFWNVVCG